MNKTEQSLLLSPEQLKASVSLDDLPFVTTEALEPWEGVVGQERPIEAMQFGIAMAKTGYNLFVMGDEGTGRSTYALNELRKKAKELEAPADYAFVNNFDNPHQPILLTLPSSSGNELLKDIDSLIDNLVATFPAAFEQPHYQQQKAAIDQAFNRKYDQVLEKIEQEALKHEIALFREGNSINLAPMLEGKVLDENEFATLPEEYRRRVHDDIDRLEHKLNQNLSELPQWTRESEEQMRVLNRFTIGTAIAPLFKALDDKYQHMDGVGRYLDEIEKDLKRTVMERLKDAEKEIENRQDLVLSYRPNLIVSHHKDSCAPVVYESNPSMRNLFGRIDYTGDLSSLATNYQQIYAGALHKANGGYLVLDAEKLLIEEGAWVALKRALKNKNIQMEPPQQEAILINAVTLQPEDIPLSVKVVLIGRRDTYYLLQQLDSDFQRMFRVQVDFENHIPRDKDSIMAFARLMQTYIKNKEYQPATTAGIARLIEYSSRLAEAQDKLTACFEDVFDLLSEAEYMREQASDACIDLRHVDQALKAQIHRASRIYERQREDILDGRLLLQTEGEAIGKINALVVFELGSNSFGMPSRVTATAHVGSSGVTDIEREASLGGSIHAKGVMILSGFLGHQYARDLPLSLSASIAMEQSYGMVEGDSASLAELCVLISALTEIPLKQNLAVTGSMNQYGEVQPIGGVNEKIEGFFDLCSARGLNGQQGVVIPKSNAENLMLRDDVVAAVAAKQFSIYAVETVDEAMELFMGLPVGIRDKEGAYPEGSINHKAFAQLQRFAQISQNYKAN